MRNFWKKTAFWNYAIKALAALGPTGGVITGRLTQSDTLVTIGLVCVGAATLLAIVMVDKDNNGLIDIFEKDK